MNKKEILTKGQREYYETLKADFESMESFSSPDFAKIEARIVDSIIYPSQVQTYASSKSKNHNIWRCFCEEKDSI